MGGLVTAVQLRRHDGSSRRSAATPW